MQSRKPLLTLIAALLLSPLAQTGAQAQSTASEASALSMLPVAISVAAPVLLLSAGVSLTVVAIESTAKGTVWVLERASDGARVSVMFASQLLAGAALSVGTAVVVSVIGSGYVLSAAGAAIAFIPNEIGASLLYNERVTR
ncbi:hypothetical protein [Roseateles oligotrophus]|uniref:ABC transporter permease n=1 Tax=Roseateles oligotrophus TaxID=1769250 RepID=A0ABT2YCL1_9BURK|nr:hypothetical protein [Roseateles oligotrophus]MCV2367765.1 hypothetical protein [Roseateles oligotrophus]